jgi:hypothetical protein
MFDDIFNGLPTEGNVDIEKLVYSIRRNTKRVLIDPELPDSLEQRKALRKYIMNNSRLDNIYSINESSFFAVEDKKLASITIDNIQASKRWDITCMEASEKPGELPFGPGSTVFIFSWYVKNHEWVIKFFDSSSILYPHNKYITIV